jgi:hypothetical protein
MRHQPSLAWTLRLSMLLMLMLGFAANASAQVYHKTVATPIGSGGIRIYLDKARPCEYLSPDPVLIYHDYGLRSDQYTNTVVHYWVPGPDALLEVKVPFGTVVYARSRVLRSDGVWEVTPEVSARASFWGGGSWGSCAG